MKMKIWVVTGQHKSNAASGQYSFIPCASEEAANRVAKEEMATGHWFTICNDGEVEVRE